MAEWQGGRDDDGVVSTDSATFPFRGGNMAATKTLTHDHFPFPSQTDVAKQTVHGRK